MIIFSKDSANKSKDRFSIKIYCIYLYKIKDAWKSKHRRVSCLYSIEINKQNKENTNVWCIRDFFSLVLKEPLDTKQKCLKNVYYWHILIPNLPSNRLSMHPLKYTYKWFSSLDVLGFPQVLSLSPMSPPNGGTSARLPILHPTPLWAEPGDRWVDMGTDRPGAPQTPDSHPSSQAVRHWKEGPDDGGHCIHYTLTTHGFPWAWALAFSCQGISSHSCGCTHTLAHVHLVYLHPQNIAKKAGG